MKILLRTTKIVAIAQIALGTIHCALTPVIMKNIPVEISKVFLFMFLATGLAFIYIGIIMLNEVKRIRTAKVQGFMIINISTGFIIISGIMAVISMSGNPFAWIAFIIGATGAAIIYGRQLIKS